MGVNAGRLWVSIKGDAASSATSVDLGARIPTQPSPFEGEGS
jgi:hypothetical protein